jgi:hypothetical protein
MVNRSGARKKKATTLASTQFRLLYSVVLSELMTIEITYIIHNLFIRVNG